jgi:hypothetical protein
MRIIYTLLLLFLISLSGVVFSEDSPLQQARLAAESHYRACLNQDEKAWIASFSKPQQSAEAGLWPTSKETCAGCTFTYDGIEKTSSTMNKFRYIRRTKTNRTHTSFITMILEKGDWDVYDVSY